MTPIAALWNSIRSNRTTCFASTAARGTVSPRTGHELASILACACLAGFALLAAPGFAQAPTATRPAAATSAPASKPAPSDTDAAARSASLAASTSQRSRASADTEPDAAQQLPAVKFAQTQAASVAKIIAAAATNDSWLKMQELCDGIGHRLSGSPALEKAVAWAVDRMKRDGHENVRPEPVMVPHWVRGTESCTMIEPRETPLAMLGLGGSVGTPPEGITAQVVVVNSQEELAELGEKVAGKIVLFNVVMAKPRGDGDGGGYGAAVRYRGMGARWASEYGAVAALVRSVTTRSLRSPHTGAMGYYEAKQRIPAAAVSTEDADMIARLSARGIKVRVTLKMEARTEPDAPSANVVAELRGRERPEEVVVIGGHLDSWDVGQGAQDDGGGCITAMEALNVLRKAGMRPRRTIRVVLFVNEENGLAGGKEYAKAHADELSKHVAAIEHDGGTFEPLGFSFEIDDPAARARALAQCGEMVKLLAPIGPIVTRPGGGGADISPMGPAGVPMLGQFVDATRYFDYHHTNADTLDKIDPADLTKNVAAMAAMAYLLAEAPGRIGDDWTKTP